MKNCVNLRTYVVIDRAKCILKKSRQTRFWTNWKIILKTVFWGRALVWKCINSFVYIEKKKQILNDEFKVENIKSIEYLLEVNRNWKIIVTKRNGGWLNFWQYLLCKMSIFKAKKKKIIQDVSILFDFYENLHSAEPILPKSICDFHFVRVLGFSKWPCFFLLLWLSTNDSIMCIWKERRWVWNAFAIIPAWSQFIFHRSHVHSASSCRKSITHHTGRQLLCFSVCTSSYLNSRKCFASAYNIYL